jgi:hypothetical protein
VACAVVVGCERGVRGRAGSTGHRARATPPVWTARWCGRMWPGPGVARVALIPVVFSVRRWTPGWRVVCAAICVDVSVVSAKFSEPFSVMRAKLLWSLSGGVTVTVIALSGRRRWYRVSMRSGLLPSRACSGRCSGPIPMAATGSVRGVVGAGRVRLWRWRGWRSSFCWLRDRLRPHHRDSARSCRHPPRAGPGWHDSSWTVDSPGSCSSTAAPRGTTRCRWRRPGDGDQLEAP